MLNGSVKQDNYHPTTSLDNKKVWIFLFFAGISPLIQAQTLIKTIIINQISYGGSNTAVINGNGIMAREKRVVDPFQGIRVEGAMSVNYRRAANIEVEVTGDQNLLPLISTQVDQGVLLIRAKQSYQNQQPLIIELGSPHLSTACLQGAVDINLKGLSEKSLHLDIKGSGDVIAEGNAEQLSVQTRGSGNVNAKGLASFQADLQVTGSGSITSTVRESLKASIVGSGDITYFGHPKTVTQNVMGSGQIAAGD